MTVRRVQLWAWWLLPFLVARALMPMGFMAQAQPGVGGKLQIVFCSAFAQLGETHDDHGNKTHDGHNDFSCPFAHVAAAPLSSFNGSELIPFLAATAIQLPAITSYYAVGPPRFIATRGPPRLA